MKCRLVWSPNREIALLTCAEFAVESFNLHFR